MAALFSPHNLTKVRTFMFLGREISISMLKQHQDYRRPVAAIDRNLLDKTLDDVQEAFEGGVMLTPEQQKNTQGLVLTSMPHESNADPVTHSTLVCIDKSNQEIATGHVVAKGEQQTPAR